MPFEKNLRRLIKKLPEHDVPSGLQARTLAQLTEPDQLQKVGFDMKLILIPALTLSMMGALGGLFVLRSNNQQISLLPFPGKIARTQTGPVTLHFVDASGQAVPQARVTLWGYEKPEKPGEAPPALVIGSPNRVEALSDAQGDVTVTNGHLSYFSATAAALPLHASGEITVSEGEQVVTLTEHPEHTITGRFVDTQGKPLMGLKPELYVVDSQTTQGLMTDPQGHFIAWIVPGNEYRISLSAPGYRPFVRDHIRVEKGQKLELDTITLQAQ